MLQSRCGKPRRRACGPSSWRSPCSFPAERPEQSRRETAKDLEFIGFDRVVVLLRALRDHPCIEREDGGRGPDVALQRLGQERLDQGALFANPARAPVFAQRDLLAQLGREIGRKIEAALRPAFWVPRFSLFEL